MKNLLLLGLLALAIGGAWRPASARWVVRYQWIEPERRFVSPVQTRAELRYRLCWLESGAHGYREAEAAAIRCRLANP